MDNPETPQTVDVENAEENNLESCGFSEVCFIELAGTAENGKMVNVCNKDESGNVDEEEIKFVKEIDSTTSRCFTACMDGVVDELKCVKHNELEKGYLSDGGDVDCKIESEIGTEKIVDIKHDEVDLEGDDSAMKIEVSGDGLSLFVDFSNVNDDVLDSEKISSENISKEDMEKTNGVDNGDRNYDFSEGDIVWVKTKNQKWWPGKVADRSAVAISAAAAADESGSLHVEYFGSSNVTKCLLSQLKPLQEDFKLLSENNKSRRFIGALEKATNEFGRHIRLEMICSCVEDGIEKEMGSLPSHKSSVLGKFSVSHFEPALFIAHLRSIAQGGSVSENLELIIMQYRLSAIYCSMGYLQLPLHQLYDTSDEGDSSLENFSISAEEKEEIISKSRKRNRINDIEELELSELDSICRELDDGCSKKKEHVSEPRERKRSKYLSYPYINWGQISMPAETEDCSARKVPHGSVQETIDDNYIPGSDFVTNRSGNKFWSKWYKKFSSGSDVFGNSESINMSPADFLSELRFVALNCQYPSKNQNFVSVGWFFSRFRISEFHDESPYSGENVDITAESCPRKMLVDIKLSSASKSEDKKRKRQASLKNEAGCNPISDKEECKSKDEGRTMSLSGLSEVNINIAPSSSLIKDSLEIGPHNASGKPKRKKQKGEASLLDELSKQRTSIPDLNGGHGKPERKKRQKMGVTSEHSVVASELLNVNQRINEGSFVIDLQGTPAYFSRKHEDQSTMSASGVPDLNGTDVECSLQGKDIQDGSASQSLSKKEKRECEAFSGDQKIDSAKKRPDMNTDSDTVGRNGGLATILLTFSPEDPTPSKEELITTFGKFGPLRESEIKFTDSSNALVVFTKDGDAIEALRSLEKNKPFGAAIVKSQLCNHSAASWFSDSCSSKSSPLLMEEQMTAANFSEWKQT